MTDLITTLNQLDSHPVAPHQTKFHYHWPEPTPEDKELNWDINWDFLVKVQELSKQYGEIPLEHIEAVLKALNKV